MNRRNQKERNEYRTLVVISKRKYNLPIGLLINLVDLLYACILYFGEDIQMHKP